MSRRYKEKPCRICGDLFLPTGNCAKYCVPCGVKQDKVRHREAIDRYRARKGVKVGVGSGNNQLKGKDRPTYKTGIASFMRFSRAARHTIRFCERCGKDLLEAKQGEWAVHHKDHDRTHNERENWELLCKRCHQVEHECWKNFPKAA